MRLKRWHASRQPYTASYVDWLVSHYAGPGMDWFGCLDPATADDIGAGWMADRLSWQVEQAKAGGYRAVQRYLAQCKRERKGKASQAGAAGDPEPI